MHASDELVMVMKHPAVGTLEQAATIAQRPARPLRPHQQFWPGWLPNGMNRPARRAAASRLRRARRHARSRH